MHLNTPISELTRVGKTSAKPLGYLGVKTAVDLLYYFPFRYEDYRRLLPIAQLRPGQMVTVRGQVELIKNKRAFYRGRRAVTEALISDDSGSLRVTWFNQPFLAKNIHVGDVLYLSGKVRADMIGAKLVSPIYEKAAQENTKHTARLVPIYPSTRGLSQKQIRFLVSQILPLADKAKEWLPENILSRRERDPAVAGERADLAPLHAALRGIHFPSDDNELKLSVERFKFEELFLTQLRAELARRQRASLAAPLLAFKEEKIKSFVAGLPFKLTGAQKVAAWDILQDIAKTRPMNRLLSGDVGSGKTVVAAIAIYEAFLNGYQAAVMAPTEILAQQHYQSLKKLLSAFNIAVGLLVGSQTAKLKKNMAAEINQGTIGVAVGTHALLSENVQFQKLGLVVVDEQHRFGVEQRKLIKQKGSGAHFLSMTATPIPRSLALMIYGDLDVSQINELPPGRKKIITRIVVQENRNKAYDFIRQQVKSGRQVFVICPLIEEIENEGLEIINYPAGASAEKRSVLKEYEKLSKQIFSDLRVGYLHGKLRPAEKEKAMSDFKDKKTDILISTSVVEVGIDIPNASVMMIEGAESFGLAQLHQFRGRVGRAQHQSYCLLFYNALSERTRERLEFFEKTDDGFKLAEKDLEMRGPGEVYGTQQSGEMNLRLAKLTDRELIKKAQDAAQVIVLNQEKYPRVMKKVKDWEHRVHLE